jgi:hypothetical protein
LSVKAVLDENFQYIAPSCKTLSCGAMNERFQSLQHLRARLTVKVWIVGSFHSTAQ